jgi:hypothetical protein
MLLPATTSAKQLAFAAIACFLQLGVLASSDQAPERTASSLPHRIVEEDYNAVLTRFHASVPRTPRQMYQIHSELRIVTVSGEETTATVDEWRSGNLCRLEERAQDWFVVSFSDGNHVWSSQQGTRPMRLWAIDGFSDLFPRPNPAERRIRIYAPKDLKMNRRKIRGVMFSCSGKYAGAEICFDAESGFPIEATVDQEQVVYQGWSPFGDGFYPNRLALYRGRRLQLEASTTIADLTSTKGTFQIPAGATESSPVHGMYRVESHHLVRSGQVDTASFGDALVKVFVDDTGRVRRAELLDADDKYLGAAALRAAKQTLYVPDRSSGERQAFEGEFFVSQWSTVDPMRVEATSVESHGTD